MQPQTSTGGGTPRRDGDLSELRGNLRGELIEKTSPGYDEARKVFNRMIDRFPRAIIRCADAADVIACVRHARRRRMAISIRCGGHNAGGLGVADDALVIDLSKMRGVRVDPHTRLVRVDGGCVFGDVDHATHAYGLAVPNGILSTTGVGGLTLGGGSGHLTRRYGLTIDSLVSADVVLSDGQCVTASETSHPDLFWALRGGGGNFGVVTSFEFRGRPVRDVIAGPVLFPIERMAEVLSLYREWCPALDRDMTPFFAAMTVPPGPPFPERVHGLKACGLVVCHLGTAEQAESLLAPIMALEPMFAHVGPVPLPALQSLFDGLYPPGHEWYWRADFVRELPDAAIAAHVEHAKQLPTPQSTMHLYPLDGAVHDVAADATAFRFRDVHWSEVIVGVDPDPRNAQRITDWARGYHEAVHPYGAGGAYVNFMMDEGQDRVRATYGDNYERLTEVKRWYDPDNVFHVNQNIRPAAPQL